ncbi:MAG: PSD1 and planctomycete cytochrome C domain-containing protein [Phycisphaeraceae bacterium]
MGAIFAAAMLIAASQAAVAAEVDPVSFNRDIRPIMSDTCFKCHGPATQKAKLRLDIREEAIKLKGDITPIVPGKPEASEIIKRIFSTEPDDIMPPADSHRVLTAAQKETFKRWVAQGAVYQKHWSFEPPVKAPLPMVNGLGFKVNNAIDTFIADRLRREKLTMSPEADKRTLIRRAAFALTGLPPTIEDVNAYVNDKSDTAYEKMIDRYLASDRFGEEMARHWLDVARYGDTHGMHLDNERQMWAYRDWVIKAFNTNLPFDQFALMQIAGDLLAAEGQGPGAKGQGAEENPQSAIRNPQSSNDSLAATGFLRCNVTTGEGGSITAEWIYQYAVERTSTVSQVFMGLTAGCAVCHDHKFDPISAKEYYSLYAFFNSAADPGLDGNALLTAPSIKMATQDQNQQLAALDVKITAKNSELEAAASKLAYTDPAMVEPKPAASTFDTVLFDDTIPEGSNITASPGHPPTYVSAENGKVHSGKKSLKRADKGLTQDVIQNVTNVEVTQDGRVYVHIYIDPNDVPKTVMIQYHSTGWLHRAVWGDYKAIEWGAAGTTQRVHIGPLPEAGKWFRLEVEAEKIGLKTGDKITGFAFTQFGGTVYWDAAGLTGKSDPTTDPRRSMLAWWNERKGKDTPGAPNDVKGILKAGPDAKHPQDKVKKLRDYYLQNVCIDTQPALAPIANEIAAMQKQKTDLQNSITGTFVFRDLPKQRESFVMLRGAYNKPGEKVEPGTPAVLPPLEKREKDGLADRLDLARWLVAKEHPLTSRVQVNRLWQQFFGTGLVKTGDDFGSQGEVPTHPQLLDWLAVQYQESGWDTKAMVKLIVMSAAFRQETRVTPALYERDPENRLYARGPRFRLDAEQIRDNALFVSGLINFEMGGRGVRTYQPPNIWEPVGFTGSNTAKYTQDKGDALYRRSIYVFLKRTAPPPFMSNFDGPSREAFCAKRERSNSPLQALQLMNDVQQVEAARVLAQRMMTEGGAKVEERIAFAYRLLLSREPEVEETAIVKDTFAAHHAKYQKAPAAAKKLINNGESDLKKGLDEPELAAWTMVANLLLNLDETLNRN